MKKMMIMAAALLVCGVAAAQVNDQPPYVEVTAKASKEVAPDEIFVRVTLDENDSKGKKSITQLERDMFAAIRSAGIDEKKVEISDASTDLKIFVLKKNTGFTTKQYRVMVTSEQLSPLFIALDRAEIYNLNVESARYSKVAELRDELRVEAAKTAKMRAELLARAVGQELGKAISIVNYDNEAVPYRSANLNVMIRGVTAEKMDAAGVPQVDFQKISVESSVTIRFALP